MIRHLIIVLLCTAFCWSDQPIISLIPKKLWQTYKTKTLPNQAFGAQQTWLELNPTYSYFIFDDADIETYIRQKWSRDFLKLYKDIPIGAMKADLWRYMILTTEGGIYSDIDSICIEPIDNWLLELSTSNRHVLLLDLDVNERWFCQWTIASTPHHPVMLYVCNYILQKWQSKGGFPKKKDGSIRVLHATGPAIFTSAIKRYLKEPDLTAHDIYKKYIHNHEYRTRLNKLGIFISPKRFFLGGGAKNLFGSQTFGDGYNSWSHEADQLAKNKHK